MNSESSRVYQDNEQLRNENFASIDFSSEIGEMSEGGMRDEVANNLDNLKKTIKDIRRKPIIDWKTSNLSFLELHNDLKRLGVKNNKFFLYLYDRDLQGIDPYSPVLPIDYQLKIILECMVNPWYFLREVCRIPEDGAPLKIGGGTRFRIDRNAVASWYLFLNGIDQYDSKPRQRGKTQNALAIINYAYHFGTVASTITFANKDASNNKMNLYRLKCQRDMLPAYMQMKIGLNESGSIDKGRDSVTSLRNPVTNNNIMLLSRPNSSDSAMSVGRGFTSAIQYWDEFDFIPFNTVILDSSAFAYATASDNARKNNSLYGRIWTSTPGDLDSPSGRSATEWINGSEERNAKMYQWRDKDFDILIDEFKEKINSKGFNGIVFVEHTWQQLKCSIEWYEKQCRLVSFNQTTIMREIELKRLRGSSTSPFKRDDLFALINMQRQPIASDDMSNNLCPFYFYESMDKKFPYIISIDPSEGLGQDNNAIQVINPASIKTSAEMKTPYISQTNLAKMIVEFMDKYCPKALIVVEANKGRELINQLLESKYRYSVWYDNKKLEKSRIEITTGKYGPLQEEAHRRRAYGFDTTRSTRPLLYSLLETYVSEEKHHLNSKDVVDDILSLERKSSGIIAATNGSHDDSVMAFLIGAFVFLNAENLDEFGLYRGITQKETLDINDPTSVKMRIKELEAILPDEYKELLEDVVPKDPISASWDYQKEVQRIIRSDPNVPGGDPDLGPGYAISIEQESALDERILSMNQCYNGYKNENFNLDDYLE